MSTATTAPVYEPRPGATVTTTVERPSEGYTFRSFTIEIRCTCGNTRTAWTGGNLTAARAWEVNADQWANEQPDSDDPDPVPAWDLPRDRAQPIRCGRCRTAASTDQP